MVQSGILSGCAPILPPVNGRASMRRRSRDGVEVMMVGSDRSFRSIAMRVTRCSMIRTRSIRTSMSDRMTDRSNTERSIAINSDRFDEKLFSNYDCDLLTRDDRHVIDSADMVARIFASDHPDRCPTQFDPLLELKGKRSPSFFFSSQTQSVVQSAVTSCNSLR